MALISIKDVKQAVKLMMDILEKLDEIYHALKDTVNEKEEELRSILEKKYKEIDAQYKLLRKIADIETAKKMLEEIWHLKSFANAIELELIKRGFYNGTSE